MPLIGFKKQFAPKILAGEKPFTLRALRRDGRDPKMGQVLFMYIGLRSKQCKKFAELLCRFAINIKLNYRSISIPGMQNLKQPDQLELFSRLDGFEDYAGFCQFHEIKPEMTTKEIRLIAWITRDELNHKLSL